MIMIQYPLENVDISSANQVNDEAGPTRRQYAAPRLIVFGSVSTLTRSGTVSPVEVGSMAGSKRA